MWSGKRVFLTGHTGFKGGWLALWLTHLGSRVCGYSLAPSTRPSFFEEACIGSGVDDLRGDICDSATLDHAMMEFEPEIVFHLAAQPLVRFSYADPVGTYQTNVMGTAKILDAVRRTPAVRAVVTVTTDKCYANKESVNGYRETDRLGGSDPYSSSKACAELVVEAFRQSYFPAERYAEHGVALATARAGNVIGGGDWAVDRLVPDLIRGFLAGSPVGIRRPLSIRPWQHVLDSLHGYLLLGEKLLSSNGERYSLPYNFGPAETDARTVEWIANQMTQIWGTGAAWFPTMDTGLHETATLKLDASRARTQLGWEPQLDVETALKWLVDWHKARDAGANMYDVSRAQIRAYEDLLQ